MSLVPASARDGALLGGRGGKLQQLAKRGGSGLMQGRTHSHFDGFQIEMAALPAFRENDAQQLVYFARDFLADDFGRFFSSGVRVSPTGRKPQIFRFTSTNWLAKD
jgi:hypothetical protein